jgi:hypothetical protein
MFDGTDFVLKTNKVTTLLQLVRFYVYVRFLKSFKEIAFTLIANIFVLILSICRHILTTYTKVSFTAITDLKPN